MNAALATFQRPVADFTMPSSNAVLVLAQARTLQGASRAGRTQPLLRGKRFGLVCAHEDDAGARLFRRAASELGAHVAHVRPVLDASSPAAEVGMTARLLGRLYDAVECQGLPPAVVRQLADDAGVPVYDGIAAPGHPIARLADLLDDDDDTPAEDRRRFVLQAVLLNAVA